MLSKRTSLALLLISWSAWAPLAVVACTAFGDGATPPPPSADGAVPDATVPDTSVEDSGNTPEPTDAGADEDATSTCVVSPPGLVAWWTGDDTLEDHHGPHEASSGNVRYVPASTAPASSSPSRPR